MFYLTRTILIAVCLAVLSAELPVAAQKNPPILMPNQPVTFSLAPNGEKSFSLPMKAGDYAEIDWIAPESEIGFQIYDSTKKTVLKFETNSYDEFSIFDAISDEEYFVAPKDDTYTLRVRRSPTASIGDAQNISIEYRNKLELPAGTKLTAVRKINGYDVRILTTPERKDLESESLVVIEKYGRLQRVKKGGGGGRSGFYFFDDVTKSIDAESKREATLIRATLDKTGDGIPDIMIGYYSGGNACCAEAYFFNLGDSVELVSRIGTAYTQIVAKRKSLMGGLIFEVSDTSFYYWNAGYNSPTPTVILAFRNGLLRPDFALMKKAAPSLAVLRKKAQITRGKLSLEPYEGEGNDPVLYKKEVPTNSPNDFFWGEILDLIYSGNEELAWQFLELAWPSEKRGKAIFEKDLKKKIADSFFWRMIKEDQKK